MLEDVCHKFLGDKYAHNPRFDLLGDRIPHLANVVKHIQLQGVGELVGVAFAEVHAGCYCA